MIFELVRDFADALEAMPREHARHRILKLLDEAIRRDVHFIADHREDYPQSLFQCAWNNGWWYDCPEAANFYVGRDELRDGTGSKLFQVLERWRRERAAGATSHWLRALHPPSVHLNSALHAIFRGHKRSVDAVAISPDGAVIASAAYENIRVWDVRDGKRLAAFGETGERVKRLAFSPDGARLLSGADRGSLRVWDARQGRLLTELDEHDDTVDAAIFLPDGRHILGGSRDKTVRVWRASDGKQLAVLRGHDGIVRCVASSPDGIWIASGADDGMVCIWKMDAKIESRRVCEHESPVQSMTFSPDGRTIVTGTRNGAVRLWDVETGRLLRNRFQNDYEVSVVSFSADGTQIVAVLKRGTVRVWDAETGATLSESPGYPDGAAAVTIFREGNRVVTGGYDGAARIWNVGGGETFVLHEMSTSCVAFSSDGRQLVSSSYDGIRFWDSLTGNELSAWQGRERYAVSTLTFSPDGKRLAGGDDKSIRIWDAADGAELAVLNGLESSVRSIAFSGDGARIAGALSDGTIRIWSQTAGWWNRIRKKSTRWECVAVLQSYSKQTAKAAFAPDGKLVVCGTDHGIVRVWELIDRFWHAALDVKIHTSMEGHVGVITSVAFTSDGDRVISSGEDNTTRIWNPRTGICLQVLSGRRDTRILSRTSDQPKPNFDFHKREPSIESAEGRQLACFPESLHDVVSHPHRPVWAVLCGRGRLVLLQLEEH